MYMQQFLQFEVESFLNNCFAFISITKSNIFLGFIILVQILTKKLISDKHIS